MAASRYICVSTALFQTIKNPLYSFKKLVEYGYTNFEENDYIGFFNNWFFFNYENKAGQFLSWAPCNDFSKSL